MNTTPLPPLPTPKGKVWPPAAFDDDQMQAYAAQNYAAPVAQQDEHLTITWDEQQTRILAVTMQDEEGRILKVLAEAPALQPQYEAGDMASAHNDGFRAGVASVAQQPQADLLAAAKEFCRKVEAGEARSTKSYAAFKLAIERIEKQQQAGVPPPANCRQRLAKEGKLHPRSSCAVCGPLSPKWQNCNLALALEGAKK